MREYAETMIAWNYPAEVAVGPYPDTTGWSEGFECIGGALDLPPKVKPSEHEQRIHVMATFIELVADYRINPHAAHKAFLKIRQYREAVGYNAAAKGIVPSRVSEAHEGAETEAKPRNRRPKS